MKESIKLTYDQVKNIARCVEESFSSRSLELSPDIQLLIDVNGEGQVTIEIIPEHTK